MRIFYKTISTLLFIVLFTLGSFTTLAIRCYVCGHESDSPFYETKSTSINQSLTKETIHASCDEFDSKNISFEEKQKYIRECPKDTYVGCSLKVGAKNVRVRTCSEIMVTDCKAVNKNIYCNCKDDLCNGENKIESIIQTFDLRDTNDSDDYDDEDDDDSSLDNEGSGFKEATDDEEVNLTTTELNTSKKNESDSNEIDFIESTATLSTINKAVSFNLPTNLMICMSFISLQWLKQL